MNFLAAVKGIAASGGTRPDGHITASPVTALKAGSAAHREIGASLHPELALTAFERGISLWEKLLPIIREHNPYCAWNDPEEYLTYIYGVQTGIGNRVTRGYLLRKMRLKVARWKGEHKTWQWKALCKELENRCVCCGKKTRKLEKDHIVPIYRGGSDCITNLQPLCRDCHLEKAGSDVNYIEYRKRNGFSELEAAA
jgi:hypothetical protein